MLAIPTFIDSDKRGYDELFKYFDEYVEFEELIFASDSFYRDHTVHCLWVYFLGEYITKNDEYKFLFEKSSGSLETLSKMKSVMIEIGSGGEIDEFCYAADELAKSNNYDDSISCLVALTHDLGYPLKKINKINKSIGKVLPYFSINNYDEFNFYFDNIQKNNIDSFINFLSENITISIGTKTSSVDLILKKIIKIDKGEFVGVNKGKIGSLSEEEQNELKNNLEVLIRLKRHMESYIRYCNDFEEYQGQIKAGSM